MSIKNLILPFILFVVAFSGSCKENSVFEDKSEISKSIWQIEDSLCFDAEIQNINQYYNIFLKIDVKEDFLTENLWLLIKSKSPSGNILNDTVMFFIIDKTGKWFGKKHGDVIKNKFLYKTHVLFPEKGNYRFCISHGMRKEDLPRVTSVGISIEKAE